MIVLKQLLILALLAGELTVIIAHDRQYDHDGQALGIIENIVGLMTDAVVVLPQMLYLMGQIITGPQPPAPTPVPTPEPTPEPTPTLDDYCRPGDDCWSVVEQSWSSLAETLEGELHLFGPDLEADYQICRDVGQSAFAILNSGNGICMMYHDCSQEFCDVDNENTNLPAAAVAAVTMNDLRAALEFARTHRLYVTIKTSGHSYAGSSTGRDSLMILTRHLETNQVSILEDGYSVCGNEHPHVITIGGGTVWQEVYDAVGDEYNIVGGFGATVSAIGGWMQGGGLSPLVRKYGLGIDQVLELEVMLLDGTIQTVSPCQNSDLFFAIRGGGGGTYGIVISAQYLLHPVEPVTEVVFALDTASMEAETAGAVIDSFLHFWIVEQSPTLPNEWGGYWSNTFSFFYYTGNESGAQPFIDALIAWRDSLVGVDPSLVTIFPRTMPSYQSARALNSVDPELAGDPEEYIATRYVSQTQFEQDPELVYEAYASLVATGALPYNYMMGGAVRDVGINETAIHPHARDAIWQLTFIAFGGTAVADETFAALRAAFPNQGAGYNHGYKREPNWRRAFWGDQLEELESLKAEYDPDNLLNCYHCIGYRGPEPDLPYE